LERAIKRYCLNTCQEKLKDFCKTHCVERYLEAFGELYEHVVTCLNVMVNPHVYPEVKNTHNLKAFLTQEALVTVIRAIATFRIDYCNSLLYGISDHNIQQIVQLA